MKEKYKTLELRQEIKKAIIIEDEQVWQLLIARALHRINHRIECQFFYTVDDALTAINSERKADIIIADLGLKGVKTGLDLWDNLLRLKLNIPYAILSGTKKSDFIKKLTPYRQNIVPLYIEKPNSINKLTMQFFDAFNIYFNLNCTTVNIVKPKSK